MMEQEVEGKKHESSYGYHTRTHIECTHEERRKEEDGAKSTCGNRKEQQPHGTLRPLSAAVETKIQSAS